MKRFLSVILSVLVFAAFIAAPTLNAQPTAQKAEVYKAGRFDTGRMWAFDFLPTEYIAQTYGFNPSKEWFEKARLSAVRLQGCTGSFISEDGLVMTNHHCARGAIDKVMKPGEDLHTNGFYAETLADERQIPGAYIDQLVLIEDVTEEVIAAFNTGKTDEEKVKARQKKISEIQDRRAGETKLECNVISFYNGGRYSLYGYKRYKDIRLVFAVETQTAFYGGDPDNFTYPRYDLDMAYYRVYENGKPLKTENFFKWSPAGASEGDAVFVIGNPGRTGRLVTVAQLEFNRDYAYASTQMLLDNLVKIYDEYITKHPDQRLKYENTLFGWQNSQKSYKGRLDGLKNPVLMGRKVDFEANFKAKIAAKPELQAQYGKLWDEIADIEKQRAAIFMENAGLFVRGGIRGSSSSAYFGIASDLVELATQAKLPDEKRMETYKAAKLDSAKVRLFNPPQNDEIDMLTLVCQLDYMQAMLGTTNAAFNELMGGKTPAEAAAALMKSTILTNKDKVLALAAQSPDEILKSSDPFVKFVAATDARSRELRDKMRALQNTEGARVQVLGRALYDAYGTSIPPDATFTLRLADGVVKGYPYNGTIAPPYTTFYGLYDRYHSFGGKYPFDVAERWKTPPAGLDLSTPFNFVATCDIIGGNSGSPIVNKNLEVVGLVFDGNIESLPGDFIFDDTVNRTVAVHSAGILAAFQHIYKADRLVKELKAGKIQ